MFQFGPLSIPYSRFFLLLVVMVIGLTSEIVAGQKKNKMFSIWGWNVGFIALVVARVGFVITHLSDFLLRPLSMFYIWQGDFDLLWGILGGVIYTLWFFRKQPKMLSATILPIFSVASLFLVLPLFTPNANTAQPLPELILYTLDHNPVELSAFIGNPLVINVWATWCPPCRREMPMLNEIAKDNPNIDFLLIDQGEEASKVQEYFASINISSDFVLLDPKLEYSQHQGVVGYPSTFFYDTTGKQVDAHYGELSRASLNDYLKHIRKTPHKTE